MSEQPSSTLSLAERVFKEAAESLGYPVVAKSQGQRDCRVQVCAWWGARRTGSRGPHDLDSPGGGGRG